jgi:tetratricopeptide (TPR) repeat protein
MRAMICLVFVAWAASAQAADRGSAQGHARKANSLAAAGKCKQALPEYDTAYRTLKDPALLFNRAECLRKLGKNDLALQDYRKFLDELPEAPNRRVVESRIAALDPSSVVRAKVITQAPPPAPPAKVAEPAKVSEPVKVAEPVREPEPALRSASLRVPPPEAESSREPALAPQVLVSQPAADAPSSSESRAWIWLSVAAAVVAGVAVGAVYVAGRPRNP